MSKRLFLFAAHDPQDRLSETALWYLSALKELGSIRFSCDNNLDSKDLEKLEGMCEYVFAAPHGEYDFGSYKRAFKGAALDGLDYLYLVNDSVAGPLYPLEPFLEKMEASGADAFALARHPSRRGAHLQSWFIGFRSSVFRTDWFACFLGSVTAHPDKGAVYELYENGLTRLLEEHGATCYALYSLPGKSVYNNVAALYRKGFPFLKRSALTRHGGALGGRVLYILERVDPSLRTALEADSARLQGPAYMDAFLTKNPFILAGRYLSYLWKKVTGR